MREIGIGLIGWICLAQALDAQQSELRSCTPTAFAEQSAIPILAAYVDGGEGLAIGREGTSAPFVASLQASLLWSPVASARRWAIGPVAGFTYANPKVHGLLGGRIRYRAMPFRIHDQMDLGLGLDLFADAAWETPSAALLGLGTSLDLPLDIALPINGPRLFARVLRDTRRDDWRVELGLGSRLRRKLPTNTRTPDEPERWRPAISSVQGAISDAVIADSTAPDGTALCDYTMLRAAASVLAGLRAAASRPGSMVDADTLRGRFAAAGLDRVVAQLDFPANTWRRQLADSLIRPPPVTAASAISVIAERVHAALVRLYRLGGA